MIIDKGIILEQQIILDENIIKKKVKYQLCDIFEEKIENIYFNQMFLNKLNSCKTLEEQNELFSNANNYNDESLLFQIKIIEDNNDRIFDNDSCHKIPKKYDKI